METPTKAHNGGMMDPLGSHLAFPIGVSIQRSRSASRRHSDAIAGPVSETGKGRAPIAKRRRSIDNNNAGAYELDLKPASSHAQLVLKLRSNALDSSGPAPCRERSTVSSLASFLTSPLRKRGDDYRRRSVGARITWTDGGVSPRRTKRSRDVDRDASFSRKQNQQRWLIPAEHAYKTAWDILTIFISFANAYATHTSIRDRQFGNSWFRWFAEAWFLVDIILNFFTEYRTEEGRVLQDCQSVWARYLTTWFVIDALSLIPAESLYVQPVIDQQNRRGFFKKTFFRSKAVVRVTRILRGRHLKLFGRVAGHTKHAGVGAARLLRILIKYIPKYVMFFRKMKWVVLLRALRQVHFIQKLVRSTIPVDEKECSEIQRVDVHFEDDIPLY